MIKKLQYIFITIFVLQLGGCVNMIGDGEYKTVCVRSETNSRVTCKRVPINKNESGESYKVFGKKYKVMSSGKNYQETGSASWYGKKFQRKRTYSGERFNMYQMTAAHKTLPLNTKVEVTNLVNHKKIVVRINDRGPFVRGRLIDLSYGAAKQLGMLGHGTVPVKVKAV